MKIIFITFHIEKTPPAFPLASAILKTSLQQDSRTSDFNICINEYYLPADITAVAAKVLADSADICGFSACTWNSAEILSLATELRKVRPEIKLVVGGPQATADSSTFAESGLFNSIITGEGEGAIAEAVTRKRSGSPIIQAAPVDFKNTLSPYPAVQELLHRHDGILWEVSRGCPYNCAFCYESRGSSTVQTITEERLKSELRFFRDNNIRHIWVLDPTFNHNRDHAKTVLEAIIDIYPDAAYTFEIRAELMNEELCGLLSELNASLQIGLQTTNTNAGRLINRSLKAERFLDRCRMMAGFGLTFGIDLIYGLPGDNYEGFCKSLDFAVSASPNNIDIFPLSVLPGTLLAESADKLGLKHKGFPSYEVTESDSFSRSDIIKAAQLTKAVDLLYNREQAFAWFNTAAAALQTLPAELFSNFSRHPNNDVLDFIKTSFRKSNKHRLLPVVESFIRWSRAAETAFANPGKEIAVKLCRKPELLDEMSRISAEDFLRRYPSGKDRNYKLIFDGEELYIL